MELIEITVRGKRYIVRHMTSDIIIERLARHIVMGRQGDIDLMLQRGHIFESGRISGFITYSTKSAGVLGNAEADLIMNDVMKAKKRGLISNDDMVSSILSYIGKYDVSGVTSAELAKMCKAFRAFSATDRELTLNRLISDSLIVAIGKSRKGSVRYSLK